MDPLLIARLNFSIRCQKTEFSIKYSKIRSSILDAIWNGGFIRGYSINNGFIKVYLKYTSSGNSLVKYIKCISTPGRRVYKKKRNFFNKTLNKFLIFSYNDSGNDSGGELLILVSI